jgi:hypothetical protein
MVFDALSLGLLTPNWSGRINIRFKLGLDPSFAADGVHTTLPVQPAPPLPKDSATNLLFSLGNKLRMSSWTTFLLFGLCVPVVSGLVMCT